MCRLSPIVICLCRLIQSTQIVRRNARRAASSCPELTSELRYASPVNWCRSVREGVADAQRQACGEEVDGDHEALPQPCLQRVLPVRRARPRAEGDHHHHHRHGQGQAQPQRRHRKGKSWLWRGAACAAAAAEAERGEGL